MGRTAKEDDPPKGRVVIKPTLNYYGLYIQLEQLHRSHPNWPLSELLGMTPRQRKYWIAMGKRRTKDRADQTKKIIEGGGIPVG